MSRRPPPPVEPSAAQGRARAEGWLAGPVREALAAEGIESERVSDDPVPTLRLTIRVPEGSWRCYVRAWDDTPVLGIYGVFPLDTPPPRRAVMAGAVIEANRGLDVGNFEFDPDDGELLFKTAIALGDETPSAAIVRAQLRANIDTLARFYSALAAIAVL